LTARNKNTKFVSKFKQGHYANLGPNRKRPPVGINLGFAAILLLLTVLNRVEKSSLNS
jgi:hypothetical protein